MFSIFPSFYHMIKKIITGVILISFPLIALAKAPVYSTYGTITKVTDGDTIKVQVGTGTETVRILGLDTPEKYPTRFGYVECYGEESSKYVESILPVGTQVYLEFHGNDKYKRDLADVYIGSKTGTLLSQDIIKNGYGWVYKKWIKTTNYRSLLQSELQAKRSKIGLWSLDTCNGKRTQAIPKNVNVVNTPSSSVIPSAGIDPSVQLSTGATVIQNNGSTSYSDSSANGQSAGSYAPPTTSSTSGGGGWVYAIPNANLSCSNVPTYCSGVKTREEAQFYLNSCGATKFDRDHDGIACEDIK